MVFKKNYVIKDLIKIKIKLKYELFCLIKIKSIWIKISNLIL